MTSPDVGVDRPPSPEPPVTNARRYLRLLRRHVWLLLVCLVVVPAAVYGISQTLDKRYQSSTVVQVRESSVDLAVFFGDRPSDATAGRTLAAADALRTTAVTSEALRRLQLPDLDRSGLLDAITVRPDGETGRITIAAEDADARVARRIAGAVAAALVVVRRQQARASLDGMRRRLESQLDDLPRDADASRTELVDQVQRLRALAAAQDDITALIEPASPGQVIAPRAGRNAAFAAVVGLLVFAGVLALLGSRSSRAAASD